MSLIELLVAMAVGSILMAAIGAVFIATLDGVRVTNVRNGTGADARIGVEAMSRTLRVAYAPQGLDAFDSGSTTGMSFYALLNRSGSTSTAQPIPTQVTYAYSASTTCLSETLTPGVAVANPAAGDPLYTWPASGSLTKCLLRTSTPPAFKYYISSDLSAMALSATSGLSATDLPTVRSVGVYLVVTDPANGSVPGVPVDTRIALENLINADAES